MGTKHTPGPWEFDPNGGLPVIQIYCPDGKNPFHGHRSEEEQEANARLMAAAPDLLAALQDIVLMAMNNYDIPELEQLDIAERALNAIKKARGE